ncbi:MAG: hypothetical protein GEU79_03060 [Acidimicrobiia bacterium]|nr:hypothetical protein [Acidimicrobiia bacterium]
MFPATMLVRPHSEDVRIIGFYLGRVLFLASLAGTIPIVVSVVSGELGLTGGFLLMIGIGATLFGLAEWIRPGPNARLRWSEGMVVVALAWILVPVLSAIPFFLSGRYVGFLSAIFEAMSGFATIGLTVVNDLDHMSSALLVWRQTTHFIGGQGIVLVALSVFAGGGALALYHGEARDERILPSVTSTARFIWLVSALYGLVGISALTLLLDLRLGFEPGRALLHAYSLFVAAFDTGGFAAMSTSVAFYHSPAIEVLLTWLMLSGSLSFGVHFILLRTPRNFFRNLETKTYLTTIFATSLVGMTGLVLLGLATEPITLLRRGLFHLISAHTTTGFSNITTSDLASWSGLAFAAIATAMALGGMASSTSGGVKALRVGLTIRTLGQSIRRTLLPEHTVLSNTFYQNGRRTLTSDLAQSVLVVSLLYVGLYLFGTVVGIAHGYPLQASLFEATSAASGTGLSVGITAPDMPWLLQVVYVLLMWVGRLEFISVFVLIGFAASTVVGE